MANAKTNEELKADLAALFMRVDDPNNTHDEKESIESDMRAIRSELSVRHTQRYRPL
jgi:hypothetical protein